MKRTANAKRSRCSVAPDTATIRPELFPDTCPKALNPRECEKVQPVRRIIFTTMLHGMPLSVWSRRGARWRREKRLRPRRECDFQPIASMERKVHKKTGFSAGRPGTDGRSAGSRMRVDRASLASDCISSAFAGHFNRLRNKFLFLFESPSFRPAQDTASAGPVSIRPCARACLAAYAIAVFSR